VGEGPCPKRPIFIRQILRGRGATFYFFEIVREKVKSRQTGKEFRVDRRGKKGTVQGTAHTTLNGGRGEGGEKPKNAPCT